MFSVILLSATLAQAQSSAKYAVVHFQQAVFESNEGVRIQELFKTRSQEKIKQLEAKKKEMLEFEYARSALKNGLKLEAMLGVNPYKFGMVGSSDAHTGLAAMEEENFFGKTTPQDSKKSSSLSKR